MRICIVVLVLILAGCKSPNKDYDFTFFKWNIHETYYLKFNSSDTLYYVDVSGYNREESFFTILNKEEKERIQNILDTITFPKEESFENSKVEDGETNAFVLKSEQKFKKLKIHESGPKQFWLFGKSLDKLKINHKFIETNKKVDLKEIKKMVSMPIPRGFVVDTLAD